MSLTRHNLTQTFAIALALSCGMGSSAALAESQTHDTPRTQQQQPASSNADTPAGDTARGVEFYKQGKYKEAVKLLRDATKKRGEDAQAWFYLGLSYLKSEETKKATEALQTARRLRPNDDATLIALALALVKSGDDYGAMQVASEAVEHGGRNVEAHYMLAAINYRIGRLPQALEGAEAALKLNPAFPSAHYLKGQTLLGLSDQALTNSRSETPELRTVLAEKADTRFVEAVQALETFMRLAPGAPEIPKLREEIAQMRLYRDALNPANPNRTIYAARELTTRAKITYKPPPSYTPQARRNGTTGMVRLRIVLGADGTIQHIYPTRTLPNGLTEAAVAAARKIKFTPALKDGRPVSQFVTIEYNFNIY